MTRRTSPPECFPPEFPKDQRADTRGDRIEYVHVHAIQLTRQRQIPSSSDRPAGNHGPSNTGRRAPVTRWNIRAVAVQEIMCEATRRRSPQTLWLLQPHSSNVSTGAGANTVRSDAMMARLKTRPPTITSSILPDPADETNRWLPPSRPRKSLAGSSIDNRARVSACRATYEPKAHQTLPAL